ncbi:MAG: GFA family protein [Chitinophagaceae bacterium]|nr:GFA family protein [Oligoflexus sp.]
MQTYQGGCHCQRVRYEVRQLDLTQSIACNCSICLKRGSILSFVADSQFTLKSGEGEVTDYQFHRHNIHHLFCKTCGILSYATGSGPDGMRMFAINIRCLDDIDLSEVNPVEVNGKLF